jgi:hypothetical protein
MGLLSSIELLMIGGAIFVAFGFIGLAFQPTQELTPTERLKAMRESASAGARLKGKPK